MFTTKQHSIKSFIKDYKVAAISSSSKFLVKSVLQEIENDSKVIIEQGAGDGVMSKELIKKLDKKGKLILIEQNPDFLKILTELKNKNANKNIIIFSGLIQDFDYSKYLSPNEKVDYILSSVPFFYLSERERSLVSENAYKNLKEGGKFVIFHQYRLLMKNHIENFFKKTKFKFVVRNLFPCFVIVGKK